ncbi:MAG TPA: ABC transporter ATP-binding protein [Bacteroidales bacterium]|nr:ABC transporter ATP-binding protein [Bacteroidales bacterium]
MIQVENIHKSYGNLKVLKGITLNIPLGSIISITGPSGAGKSTLLHIIGTIDRPDIGNIIIKDIEVHKLSEKKLAAFRNKHIGFVFQFHHLLPEFTAIENVSIPAYIAGKNKKEANNKAAEILEFLGLKDRLNHKPSQLSGGEQQRVAIARALINNPDVILADEPSGNLDSENAYELHKLFFKLRETFNQTFILVTHNEELAKMADKQYHMRDGLIF